MRDYLYKAKRRNWRELPKEQWWKEGYVAKSPKDGWEILRKCDNPPDSDPIWDKALITYKVDETTICQYTGLPDIKGKKIFENDIVSDAQGNYYKVFWQENHYMFSLVCVKSEHALLLNAVWDLWVLARNNDLVLIGSSYDDPELTE